MKCRLQVALVALMGCGSRPAATSAGTTPTTPQAADRVEVRGLDRVSTDRVRDLLRSATSGGLSVETASAAARALWATGEFDDVRIESPKRGHFVVTVTERPVVGSIDVLGANQIAATALKERADLRPGSPRSWAALARAREQMLAAYDERFFSGTEIDVTSRGTDRVELIFRVSEGARHTLDKLRFQGNARVASTALTAASGAKPGDPVHSSTMERWLLCVAAHYYDRGYINVHVGAPQTQGGVVIVPIREGERFRVGIIDVAGDVQGSKRAYRKLVRSRPGSVFNRSRVREDLQRIATYQRGLGHPQASVTPLTSIDAEKRTIGLTFQIDNAP